MRRKKSDVEKEEDEAHALLFLAPERVFGSAMRGGEEVLQVQRDMARVSRELHPNWQGLQLLQQERQAVLEAHVACSVADPHLSRRCLQQQHGLLQQGLLPCSLRALRPHPSARPPQ